MDRYRRLAAGVACDLSHNGGLHGCRWAAIHGEATTGCPCPDGLCGNHRAPPGHESRHCLGNCEEHPLVTGDFAVMWILENAAGNSELWGRITVDEDLEREEAETPEERAAREEAEATKRQVAAIQKKAARWTSDGEVMKFRVPKPCRYASFFSKRLCVECDKEGVRSVIPEGDDVCRAVIPSQTRKNNIGDLYTTEARYCGAPLSGCHNHETGTCIYVHPDEREWADACSGRLDTRFDNRLVFCLATDPAAMRNHRDAAPAHGGRGRGAPHHGGGRTPHHGQRSYQERPRTPAAGGAPNRFAAALAPQGQRPAPQGGQRPAPQVPRAPPAKPQSRFGSFDESSDEEEQRSAKEDRSAW
jgi:hypothetical protein